MRTYPKKSVAAVFLALAIAASLTFWTYSGGDARSEDVVVTTVYDGDTIVVGRGWRQTTISRCRRRCAQR